MAVSASLAFLAHQAGAVEMLSVSNRPPNNAKLDQTFPTPLPALHYQVSQVSKDGDSLPETDVQLSKEQFTEKMKAAVKEAGTKGIVIFVHGSFNDGQRSMHQAVRLSESLQAPVILFDWSSTKFSPAKVLSEGNYIRNQVEADRSEDDFREFLDLLDASGVPPSVVTLVGFSKGGYIIHRGLLHRSDRMGGHVAACNQFKKVILISPDIDSRTYAAQAERSTANAQRTEIWVNNADTAMTTSFKIHGKEERLGGAKYTLPYVLRNKSITVIDFNDSCVLVKARLRHEMPFELLSATYHASESMASSRYALVPDPNNENLQHLRLK